MNDEESVLGGFLVSLHVWKSLCGWFLVHGGGQHRKGKYVSDCGRAGLLQKLWHVAF